MMDFIISNARLGALLLFSSLFAMILLWMFLPGQTRRFNHIARSIVETPDEQ
jgi:cbb3-type cytochrome oxidase subunit 3